MMKNLLEKLFENETLTYDESKSVLLEISAKKYDDSLIASFLTVYKMRMPCVEEIEGLALSLGGSFSAEHGVGRLRRQSLRDSISEAE